MFGKKMATVIATAAKNAPSGGGSSRGFGGAIRRLVESPQFQAQLKKQTSGAAAPSPQQSPLPMAAAKRALESVMGGAPAARQGRGMGRFAGLAEMMVGRRPAGMKKGGAVKKKTVKAKPTMKAKARKK